MRWLLPPVLLALLAAPSPAAAGDAANPEITDASGDAGTGAAWGDVTAAWFNDTATDIVATIQLAQIAPAQPTGYVYYFVADVGTGENSTFGCFAFIFANEPIYGCSHWDRTSGPRDELEGTGSMSPGTPGTVVLHLPRAVANNATAGTVLSQLSVGTGTVAGAPVALPPPVGNVGTFVPDDAAETTATYTLVSGPGGPATATPGNATGGPGNGSAPPDGPGNAMGNEETPARTPAPAPVAGGVAVAVAAWAVTRRRR